MQCSLNSRFPFYSLFSASIFVLSNFPLSSIAFSIIFPLLSLLFLFTSISYFLFLIIFYSSRLAVLYCISLHSLRPVLSCSLGLSLLALLDSHSHSLSHSPVHVSSRKVILFQTHQEKP